MTRYTFRGFVSGGTCGICKREYSGKVCRWGTRFSCGSCGWSGEWEGSVCPRCGE